MSSENKINKEVLTNSYVHNDPFLKAFFKPFYEYIENNKDLVEIVINKPREVILLFPRGKKKFVTNEKLTFNKIETSLQTLATKNVLKFNETDQILSTELPGGHRLQAMGYGIVKSRIALSIRVKRDIKYKFSDFGIDKKTEDIIIKAIKNNQTLLVSGGTGTGKTSLTNMLIQYMNENDRIIAIEDVTELDLKRFPDHVQMMYLGNGTSEKQVDANTLLRSSLRMNPDKILVGEIHVENAQTFCNAINTGHEGSIATIHANTPVGALNSIITKVIMAGANDSAIKVLHKQLCEDVYAILQITLDSKGNRKVEFKKTSDLKTIKLDVEN
tara:strand:+ start:1049 stop:2035 length:987 start_codon:yes stop_codon:yes gene_type:complete